MGADLSKVGILLRREIEARMVAPLYRAYAKALGEEKALAILEETIIGLARQSGEDVSKWVEGDDLEAFEKGLELWTKDNALEIEILERSETEFSFNVTRCRYAEMYREIGIPELGKVLSCARDYAMIEGFNPGIKLTRTQTILEGADYCDFRYKVVKE